MPFRRGAILFDLDGTLIDTLELLEQSARYAFASRPGPAPTMEEWLATVGRPLIWQFSQYGRSQEDVNALVSAYRTYQLEHHDRLTRCYDGIPELLQRLDGAGWVMGVVTSKGDAIARRSLTHVGIDRFMRVVVGCDSTSRHKPDPEPVVFAMERLGAAPDECALVGDSPFDIEAGNAAAVTTIGVTWGAFLRGALRAARPTHLVDTPAQLESLLAQLRPAVAT